MDEREKQQILRYIETWRVAGPLLEEERRARLRAMTDEEARETIAALFFGDVTPPGGRRESGLVEQQRLFRNLK